MSLVDRVQAHADRHRLWTPATRVVAAVSGGSDSVALACLLDELSRRGRLVLAGLAHLHHHIRPEADLDAAFVEGLAAGLQIPVRIGHVDVPGEARRRRRSIEVAAREARLTFLDAAIGDLGGDAVALGHTRDDQAETVLLRLVRGAGPRGLGAMAPRSGRRVRPLLDVGRDELRRWLTSRGETWREDSTNLDLSIARNRLRHAVMPELAALNPRAPDAMARAARILAADADLLDDMATAAVNQLADVSEGRIRVDARALIGLPDALATRVVLRVLETLDPARAYGLKGADTFLEAARTGRPWRQGGLQMERIGPDAVLTRRGLTRTGTVGGGVAKMSLSVPGTARDVLGRWELEAEGPMPCAQAAPPSEQRAVFDAEVLGRHLTIRGWQAGDRVQPLGLGGHKKLQDVFVDRRVPREERALVPIVTDRHGRIAWVAGHVVGEPFRVTPASAAVVVLILRR
jgi:tRNA(Ile)-lysidine synthase